MLHALVAPGDFPPAERLHVITLASSTTEDHQQPDTSWSLDNLAFEILHDAHHRELLGTHQRLAALRAHQRTGCAERAQGGAQLAQLAQDRRAVQISRGLDRHDHHLVAGPVHRGAATRSSEIVGPSAPSIELARAISSSADCGGCPRERTMMRTFRATAHGYSSRILPSSTNANCALLDVTDFGVSLP